MIPSYEDLMRPVLETANNGEIRLRDAVALVGNRLQLTEEELTKTQKGRRTTVLSNRVSWAKTYLTRAGLLNSTRRGYFELTKEGKIALDADRPINNEYLSQFESFNEFTKRPPSTESIEEPPQEDVTPDEALRRAHEDISDSLAADLLSRVRNSSPEFFEQLIIDLLLSMGYGGSDTDAGRTLGRSGDGGVDGVIDQDILGVDQIYVQAKRYKDGNNIGAGAIRDFYGAIDIKRANKGVFFTTSRFTPDASDTAASLGNRIVLVDGPELARLMVRFSVGCETTETLELKQVDESYFEEL